MKIKEGDRILLYFTARKRWLINAAEGFKMHTHQGYVDLTEAIGKEYGSKIQSNMGVEFYLLKPSMEDYVMKSLRKTQVVYPKDMGLLASKSGLSSGWKVVESGTGSGVMTCFLANLVRPDGHVYSYDLREEFLEVAKKNLERCGLSQFVTLKKADVRNGIDVSEADLGVLDIGDQWAAINSFKESLAGSGMLVAVSPTMNQVEKTVIELNNQGFVSIESVEVITRPIESRPGITRPSTRMIGHTAYLTFARKIIQ